MISLIRLLILFLVCIGLSSEAISSDLGNSDADALGLLLQFHTGDTVALTKDLIPTSEDYKAAYKEPFAQQLEASQKSMFSTKNLAIGPKDGQSEVLLWCVDSQEVIDRSPSVRDHFPGGYGQVAEHIKPGNRICRFKFVKPGETSGMAFDGLIYVNGNWKIMPKPWRAL
jgi:hypothetical protein